MSLSSEIEALAVAEGFEQVGIAELSTPLTIGIYEQWLKRGFQGEMSYLERHLEEKREPQRLLKRARSAIVVTKNYVPHPEPVENFPLSSSTRVASYARGRDYHHFLKARLERVIAALKARYPDEEFVCFTDSSPVLERDLAKRAGLGWFGKNTCLLSREHGSLFFIAEIYTTLAKPEVARLEVHDHCGTCTRCLDACPTGALKAPRELDARLCISYLTIESRDVPAEPLRTQIGPWLFGCDICQTVCPWNLRLVKKGERPAAQPSLNDREELVRDLRFLLASSNRSLEKAFRGTAMSRAGGFGLKRNALIVAANSVAIELKPEIEALSLDPKLGDLARWALTKISSEQKL